MTQQTRSRSAGATSTGYANVGTPPAYAPVLPCACGSWYRDYPQSRIAHLVVFGHQPIQPGES